MKYFFKCFSIFIILTLIIVFGVFRFFDVDMPLSGEVLFGAVISLVTTLFYGWIDSVFIKQRQPKA